MNDITALMATMKAAAERAIEANERLCVMPPDEIFDVSLAHSKQLDADITLLNAHYDESTPSNVRALVEALEKAQQKNTELNQRNTALTAKIEPMDRRIAELEEIATDYGMKFQRAQDDLKKMALLESRTVTVKLPELCVGVVQGGHAVMVPYAAGHWFNKTAIFEMLDAAGIQVIEGDAPQGV